MIGALYRDPYVGMRARLAELDARIRDREAEVTEAFWDAFAPNLRQRLGTLRGLLKITDAESLDELTRTEGLLSSCVSELDDLIATLPSLETQWSELPDAAPDPPGHMIDSMYGMPNPEEARSVVRSFRAMVRERAPDAEIIDDDPVHVARFRDHGVPFALSATLYSQGDGQVSEVGMSLVTSIARALPPLIVRHENLALSLAKVLGLKHEVEVGEASFDGLFLIEGTKEAASLFLVPAVCAQLLVLSHYDVPTLHVDPHAQTASLLWRFEPAPRALEAAVRILSSVRHTPPSTRFRNV